MMFAVCRSDVWFSGSEGGSKRPPAQNRTFQSPPGIGLMQHMIRLLLVGQRINEAKVLLCSVQHIHIK